MGHRLSPVHITQPEETGESSDSLLHNFFFFFFFFFVLTGSAYCLFRRATQRARASNIKLIAEGYSAKECATILGVSANRGLSPHAVDAQARYTRHRRSRTLRRASSLRGSLIGSLDLPATCRMDGGGRYRPPLCRRSAPITKMTAPAAASTIFQASIPRNVAPLDTHGQSRGDDETGERPLHLAPAYLRRLTRRRD